MSKLSRTKGAGGERELCALLSDQFGQVIKRKLGQARDSGHDVDLPPYRIECKRRKRIAGLYQWIKQAEVPVIVECARTPEYVITGNGMSIPVVALRADGKDWLIVMRFADWCKIAREEIAAGAK